MQIYIKVKSIKPNTSSASNCNKLLMKIYFDEANGHLHFALSLSPADQINVHDCENIKWPTTFDRFGFLPIYKYLWYGVVGMVEWLVGWLIG